MDSSYDPRVGYDSICRKCDHPVHRHEYPKKLARHVCADCGCEHWEGSGQARLAQLHPRLHLGTSSFSERSWLGTFYPPGTAPADFLRIYAERYGTVEIDATYYRTPAASMVQRWGAVTPLDFRFALKVPKAITHDKALQLADKEWNDFLRVVAYLGDKLKFLVLQFPYWNRSSAIPDLETFIGRLDRFVQTTAAPCPLVVETRNPKWIGKELLDFLRSRKLILALQDQQWMPRPRALWDKWDMRLKTGESVYVRMLGERDRIDKLTTSWDKLVIDRSEETREWLPIVRSFLAQEAEVSLFYNNHFAGHAPASIALFEQLWTNATPPPSSGSP